ncbi:MAG TPA: hypothetical protein VMV92_35015 [Streptosporangiaceae bacterium]|nr:hypothetical protein [Streptosporangiaceae bacterium]
MSTLMHAGNGVKMSWVTLERITREEAAKDGSLLRKLDADRRPLRPAAAGLTDHERGWIGWSDCYRDSFRTGPVDPDRAGEPLRRGYSIPGVRDRDEVADRLALLCAKAGRRDEAPRVEAPD